MNCVCKASCQSVCNGRRFSPEEAAQRGPRGPWLKLLASSACRPRRLRTVIHGLGLIGSQGEQVTVYRPSVGGWHFVIAPEF